MTDREFRARLIEDSEQARRHANWFRDRSDRDSFNRKLQQVKGFEELIARFDAWKPKPKGEAK